MAIVGLIGGTLAAGSGLLVLMTWLETSLQRSLAPDEPERTTLTPVPAHAAERDQRARVAA